MMTDWKTRLNDDPLPWLLEPDTDQPAIRYFTIRDILDGDEADRELQAARRAVMSSGPVPVILDAQDNEGYWVKSGPGYSPKYRSTVWQVIFLAQLGADGTDTRIKTACEYVFNHSIAKNGVFTFNGTPSAFVHCLAGNLAAALIDLGYIEDQRLRAALELQARMITGDGITGSESKDVLERYYAYTPGPMFFCGPNMGLPCAWGAIKALLALGKVPPSYRNEVLNAAIKQGIEFLLSHDPAVADYPFGRGEKPSSSWFKLGYPIGYVSDILQNLEALSLLGQINNPRLAPSLDFLQKKQDLQGRWKMEYSLNGKMWTDIEKKGRPSKWITLRVLRVFKKAYPE